MDAGVVWLDWTRRGDGQALLEKIYKKIWWKEESSLRLVYHFLKIVNINTAFRQSFSHTISDELL